MSVARIVSRYAKSVIDLAIERDQLERVKEDFDAFAEVLKNRDFYLMLKSPVVKSDKKKKIFELLFGGKFSEMTQAFFNILLVKNRENYLPEITREFIAQYRAYKHIFTINVRTAEPIGDDMLELIRKKLLDEGLAEGHLEMVSHVDPSLVAGVVLEFNGSLYDASASRKLEAFRKSFRDNLYISKIISR